ncbi:MAG TPA: copper amine oxidase, partial [Tepidanaerobacter syntrophicus]|nr:copper amine oxidase [Tepidanaerobacter syntrophicus]
MKKTGLRSFAALLAGLMVLMSAALPVTADVKIPTLMVDGQLMSPASPLCWDNESILISLEELAAYLN